MQTRNNTTDKYYDDIGDDDDDDDDDIERNIGMSYAEKNNTSILRPILLRTFYYLAGAGFNSMLSIFNANQCDTEARIQACISKYLAVSLMEAKALNLPFDMIDSKAVVRNVKSNEIRLM
jgi:hypothetical protein